MFRRFFTKLKCKIKPYLTPTMIISFSIAWYITNGWAYTMLGIGLIIDITWMRNIGLAYLTILFLPFTPEKLITIPLAIFIQKIVFGIRIKEKIDTSVFVSNELEYIKY